MFNIIRLEMYDYSDKKIIYKFEKGINYFVGKNNSGKTEFYKFIDYMFGSSETIKNRLWYKGSLKKAVMVLSYNGISYRLTRFIDNDKCYFSYTDELDSESINLQEYKDRLQSVFSVNVQAIEQLHRFTGEHLTYRTFTLFNFLGELRQGVLIDFFDKCSDIRYSTKIMLILNYLFNENIERIFFLKNKIDKLKKDIKRLEKIDDDNNSSIRKVNTNLQKLDIKVVFDGSNGDSVLNALFLMTERLEKEKPKRTKEISELEMMFSNIEEQIKVYEKYKSDLQSQQSENSKRENLLNTFQRIIADNQQYEYLVNPLIELTEEIKNSISFSKYVLKDEVIGKLKKQREIVRDEIIKANMQLSRFTYDDKIKAVAIIEDGIKSFCLSSDVNKLSELKAELKDYRDELKKLQDADDIKKINSVSEQITQLYKSAYEMSDFIKKDFDDTNDKFHIKYIKKKNSLQTMTTDPEKGEIVYATGSHARHTLIQLCGYLVFMKILLEENKFPLIPIVVIDHISKPFDSKNKAAIGAVIHKVYESIGIDNLQMFIFDDENSDALNISPQHKENLFNEERTGFNPFYNSNN